MGAPNSGKRTGLDGETILLWILITAVILGVGSITGAVHLGNLLTPIGQALPANPFELVIGLFTHKIAWPIAATWVLAGLGVLIVALAGVIVPAVLRRRSKRSRVDVAARHMVHSPGGRLATPMLGVLDEAANVCRWRELPNLYSHYGSRGIVLMTILQSWSQGVEVWGRDGMRKLWSASNIKVYGGGVAEAEFLNELAQLVGEYRYSNTTRSRSKQGTSYSHDDDRKERTLDVSDLAAFPRGRAIMFASGAPAALLETVPWMSGPHADAVRASIAAHDPANQPAPAAANRWVAAGASDD